MDQRQTVHLGELFLYTLHAFFPFDVFYELKNDRFKIDCQYVLTHRPETAEAIQKNGKQNKGKKKCHRGFPLVI